MTATLRPGAYVTESLPMHWIAVDNEGMAWLVDTQPGGWERRKPYRGHTVGLLACARGVAMGLCLASGAPNTFAQSTEDLARARVAAEPQLQAHAATIFYDWPNWTEHIEWIATAPIAEIVEWAAQIEAQEA